jgi:hypothetical protein
MSEAAGNNENAEADKYPIKWNVTPFAYEEESQGDGNIGEENEPVGDNVKPQEFPIPHVAITMRHEPVGREKSR